MTRFTGAALAPIGCQFALARPIHAPPPAEPFGMRFFRPAESGAIAPPRFRFDHERQLAVTDDESATPLIMMPGAPEKTTTGNTDGKNPRGEEFRIDFSPDEHR